MFVTRPSASPYSCFKTGVPSDVTSFDLMRTSLPVVPLMSVRKLTLAPVTISSGIRGVDLAFGTKFRVFVQSMAMNGKKMEAKS